jgi:ankyrin repeat protein
MEIIDSVKNQNLNKLKLLIEHGYGVDIDIQDDDGFTALMYACDKNNIEIVKLLIENGSAINIQNNDGFTALMYACEKDNIEIVKLLIENDADINIQNNDGITALMIVCKKDNFEIAKLLIKNGADLNIQDGDGDTALMVACYKDNIEISKLLIENDADINIRNYDGKSVYDVTFNPIIEEILKQKIIEIEEKFKKDKIKRIGATNFLKSKNCNLDNLISNIKILSNEDKMSASESIIMFGTLNLGENNSIEVAIKLSFETYEIENNSLDVEVCIYKNIVNTLIISNYTPHLMSYLGSYNCYDLILNDSDNKILNKEIDLLVRKNPNLNTNKKRLLILEKSSGITLNNFLKNKKTKESDILSIMIQVIYTLIIFDDKHLKHNDLHGGNIFIETLPTEISLYYANNTKGNETSYIELKTKYIAKIYDFDRGSVYYNPAIPRNVMLDVDFCNFVGECNGLNNKFDLYTFLYVLLTSHRPRSKNLTIEKIIYLLIDKEFFYDILRDEMIKHKQFIPNRYNISDIKLAGPSDSFVILTNQIIDDDSFKSIIKYKIVEKEPNLILNKNNIFYPDHISDKKLMWNPCTEVTNELIFDQYDSIEFNIYSIPNEIIINNEFEKTKDFIKMNNISSIWFKELSLIEFDLYDFAIELFNEFMEIHPYVSNEKYSLNRYIKACFYLACPIWHKLPKNIQDKYSEDFKIEIDNIWNVFNNTLPISIPRI